MSDERQVLDAHASGATTAGELRKRIYPELDERLHKAAEIQIEAHLITRSYEGLTGPRATRLSGRRPA